MVHALLVSVVASSLLRSAPPCGDDGPIQIGSPMRQTAGLMGPELGSPSDGRTTCRTRVHRIDGVPQRRGGETSTVRRRGGRLAPHRLGEHEANDRRRDRGRDPEFPGDTHPAAAPDG